MSTREFVLLAQSLATKDRGRVDPFNYLTSVKLDGVRALWIPHTRGLPISEVKWANTIRDSRSHVCTGLWSRYFKPIMCPDWFTKDLPVDRCLDGELWCGRQQFYKLVSTVKKLVPEDDQWTEVDYMIFDSPAISEIMRFGLIRVDTKNKILITPDYSKMGATAVYAESFQKVYGKLMEMDFGNHAKLHQQYHLSAWDQVDAMLEDEVAAGGEGLMMRRMTHVWEPKRSRDLLKLKPWADDEGYIIGWKPGQERLHGMMGSLIVQMKNGKQFELSGFTDNERELTPKEFPPQQPKFFKNGEKITFRYRELTPDGIPREARYLRPAVDL